MRTLNIWDWKYRIFLSDSDYEKTMQFTKGLLDKERSIYYSIIDFYKGFFSLDTLMDIMAEKMESEKDELLKYAWIHRNNIIKVPDLLVKYYYRKIEILFSESAIKDKLKELVNYCNGKSLNCNSACEIFEIILGDYYKEIVNNLSFYQNISKKSTESICIDNVESYAKKIITKLLGDKTAVENFGENFIGEYNSKIIEGSGFAEWWDRDLLGENKDLLILYKNKDALNRDDFEHTVYHEIYPGHGQFYNFARKNANTIPNFDHGAMTLIEGWATYCEWNVKKTKYSETLKSRGKEFLSISLSNKSMEEKIEHMYKNILIRGYSEEQAINSILYFSQYPGFLESYYFGALCIELIVRERLSNKPIDFLQFLKSKSWGELFALWV